MAVVSGKVLKLGDEVQAALSVGRPVLALESTIITHGLPRPRNLDVAIEAETLVRTAGATPATIGVLDGTVRVGLTEEELERLANDEGAVKLSVRDLSVAIANEMSGGTTVAATAHLAARVGIKVFSTGGLGGVHRGAQKSFDESADLTALAKLPLVVVSAGVKSILDIPLTLERMETLGLAVIGYRTTDYPGFYISQSGYAIEYMVDDIDEIVQLVAARDELGIESALLVANPVPSDRQMPTDLHASVLAAALATAESEGVHGHDTTPFLLDFIQRESNGLSLDVNVDVYRGNVSLGARIAVALGRATRAATVATATTRNMGETQ